MINLDNISLQRAGKYLFRDSSIIIHAGQHVGITGANGSGKTSLFKLLTGELGADSGHLGLPARVSIAHLRQEIEYSDIAAVEYVIDGDRDLRRTEQALQVAERDHAHERIAALHETLAHIDGYNAHYRAEQLLHGLGFSREDCQRPVNTFSGGWRIRLNLAQVLMKPGEILLLDEPTNHLDLDATIWLEQWLRQFQGTLLLISHDRDFLDAVVQHIVHIENQALTLYRGNYSAFEQQRAEQLAQQQALFEKQQLRIREIEKFVSRFRAKATKARQAQSRLKELDRMQIIAAAHVDSPFNFHIPESTKISDPLMSLKQAAVVYGDSTVLEHVNLSLHPGSCIGLLGANGAGKSTLMKTLSGEVPIARGERVAGEHVRIGYFAQDQMQELDLEASALLHLQRLSPTATEQQIRNYLGGFNFHGDKALEPVRPFSGGEKARLALAIVAWQQPNLLLMDEPTNHLDLEMRHALTLALQTYKGAMLLVSHDRHLLRNCVDEFWLVADGRVSEFDGDLADYQRLLVGDNRRTEKDRPRSRIRTDARRQRQEAAAQRQQLEPVKKQLKKLESEISKGQRSLQLLEQQLSDHSLYEAAQKDQLQALLQEQGRLRQRLQEDEEQWLRCQEQLELLEAS